MRKAAYVTLTVVLVAMSGCGGSDDEAKTSTSSSPNLPPPPTTLPIPEPPARPTAGRLPRAIGELESDAEDLVDLALARKRAKVVAKAEELRALAQGGVEAALLEAKVPEGLSEALKSQTQSIGQLAPNADFLQLALAANQVSGLMPNAIAFFSQPVPHPVLKLGYLDREAQLRAIVKDRSLTERAVDQLGSAWKTFQSQVVEAGGEREAARYSRHVAVMRRLAKSFDRTAIRKEAAKGLELVDELERVFRRK